MFLPASKLPILLPLIQRIEASEEEVQSRDLKKRAPVRNAGHKKVLIDCGDVWYVCSSGLRYFVKQVNNESWRQWNPIEGGERFWLLPHSGHCVTISALPAPPHFSCQEGQQKAGKKSSDWLLYTLADKGPCQRRQIEKPVSLQQIVICFSIWKNLLFFKLEKNEFLSRGSFSRFLRWKSSWVWVPMCCWQRHSRLVST